MLFGVKLAAKFAKRPMFVQLRFLFIYLIVLALQVAICIATYLSATDMARRQTVSANEYVLDSSIERIENSLAAADNLAISINEMQIGTILSREIDFLPTDLYQLYVQSNALPTLLDTSWIIESYYIYSSLNDIIIAPKQCFLNIGNYYTRMFHYDDMDYAEWHSEVLCSEGPISALPVAQMMSGGRATRMLPIMRSIYSFMTGQPVGKVVFLINEERIADLISPVFDLGATSAHILDKNGDIVLSIGPGASVDPETIRGLSGRRGTISMPVNRQTMLVFCRVLETYEWTFVVAMPHSVIAGRAMDVIRPIIVGITIMVFFGVVITALLILHNTRPILNIADHLPEQLGGSMYRIDEAVGKLAEDYDRIIRTLKEQRAWMKSTAASRLIKGNVTDRGVLPFLLKHADIDIRGDRFYGVYLLLLGDSKSNFTADALRDLLVPDGGRLCLLAQESSYLITLLYVPRESDEDDGEMNRFFSDVYQRVRGPGKLDALFFVGHGCDNLDNVHQSFDSARQLMHAATPPHDQFIFFADPLVNDEEMYDYTFRDEQRLVNLMRQGNVEGVDELLDEIRRENFDKKLLPYPIKQLFFHRMVSTLAMMRNHDKCDNLLPGLSDISTDRFFMLVREYCHRLCEISNEKVLTQKSQLVQQALSFLQENYADPDLSLSSLAANFGISESYLSMLFKEYNELGFAAHLEALRMEIADGLLTGSKLSIEEIAHRSGYVNVDTFRKAFKRVRGASPSQQRTEHRARYIE